MKILAMDIGAGTQDILLYDSEKQLENCIKMVLPSPSSLLAARVDAIGAEGRDLFVSGHTVGGGSFSRAVKRHLSSGLHVYMTAAAACSIRNNLADVAALGIEVREKPPPGFSGAVLEADEIDLGPLRRTLEAVGEDMDGVAAAAVAVQDHGAYRSGESNRKTRLSLMRGRLGENPDPLALSYLADEVPGIFPRMISAASRVREQLPCEHIMLMDTAPAAVAGCLADPRVVEKAGGNLLLINAGNGHTLACLTQGGNVAALLEHHTKRLQPIPFASYLEDFCRGKARDGDEYMASGHGLFYIGDPPGMEELDMIAITGPNRELLEGSGLPVYYPSPGGDMMMTGPMGLVKSLLMRLGYT
ncbi:MAG: pyruvate formate lyase-activating protein [Actinobacteria bacterium]|jgi:uncharacterized protein (DUF1786 family)|nr:MAG: pyruvate formate lyase-activating protein [Actinomycetota bacterium]